VGTKDRLGAKEPKNQGKNVPSFSHGSTAAHETADAKRFSGDLFFALVFKGWRQLGTRVGAAMKASGLHGLSMQSLRHSMPWRT
jgi:hypothetical protein